MERPKRKEAIKMSFKAGVKTPGDQEFCFNGLRFATHDEAKNYVLDLERRWTSVISTTVETSDDPVDYAFVDGEAKRIRDEKE
jgi:hypothetical protein